MANDIQYLKGTDAISSSVDIINSNFSKLKDAISTNNVNISQYNYDIQNSIDTLKNDFNALIEELNKKIESQNSKISSMEADITELRSLISQNAVSTGTSTIISVSGVQKVKVNNQTYTPDSNGIVSLPTFISGINMSGGSCSISNGVASIAVSSGGNTSGGITGINVNGTSCSVSGGIVSIAISAADVSSLSYGTSQSLTSTQQSTAQTNLGIDTILGDIKNAIDEI